MRKLFFLASIIFFYGLTCASQIKSDDTVRGNTALVSAELIREAGWTHNWQMNLPLKSGEKIDRLRVVGSRLYAMTDTNILFSIDLANIAV